MKKKFILLAAPPASGKNYVSDILCSQIDGISYVDKDNLSPLVHRLFKITNHDIDMDGEFYKENIRDAEYDCLFNVALNSIKYSNFVLINAPLGKEIRDVAFMQSLKDKLNQDETKLVIIWIYASSEYCKKNMIKRNAERDKLKLVNWENYIQNVNFNPPYELLDSQAVDKLLLIETRDETSFKASIQNIVNDLKKE